MRMTELVHLDVADAVATVTLDSEHNRNALSRQLVTELGERLATADGDAEVKAVLVRSAGRVFCSGADLSEATDGGMEEGARAIVALQRQIATAGKPVVVELGGPVRAGGLGIVGAADLVVAAESVTFALTEVRLGLAPAVISLSLLTRLSPRAAADIFLTGRTFDAAEAERIGLVTRRVPDGELAVAVQGVLADLVQGYPQGLRETKALLNHDLVGRIDALGEQMATLSARLFGSDEAREAMLAFLASRKT
jgi:enoyl-CoA hydratase/carnithine racemase